MENKQKKVILMALRQIPGVGVRIAEDLYQLGIRSVDDLKNRNPEKLYEALCIMQKQSIDRCMLYVFRCAVYFASNSHYDPELLK